MYIIVNSNDDLNKLQQVKNSSNVLVWYYADWCGHCQMMKDEWEKLVESKPNVSLAKVSDTYVKPSDNIMGFPTLKLFKGEKKVAGKKNDSQVIDYYGSRDAESLKEFLNENVKGKKKVVKRKSHRKSTKLKKKTKGSKKRSNKKRV